jgi:hydrogenase maturation protease
MRHPLPDPRPRPRLIVAGIGNPDRGDDGAGPLVTRLLRDRAAPGTDVIEAIEPTSLLTAWGGVDAAWIVDASGPAAPLRGPGRAGSVHRIAIVDGVPSTDDPVTSTHGLGIAQVIGISRVLGDLPPLVVIYTITAHRLSTATSVHPQVAQAARTVAQAIADETNAYPTIPR